MSGAVERRALGEHLTATLRRGGFNITKADMLGDFYHVRTFKKYEARLSEAMLQAGWRTVYAKDGEHLSGPDGFRMCFQLERGKPALAEAGPVRIV